MRTKQRKERLMPSSRRVTLQQVPPAKRDTTFIGATLTIVGGVLLQIAIIIHHTTLGNIAVTAAAIGLITMAIGSLLSRRTPHRTTDKRATITAALTGVALVIIAVILAMTTPLAGVAFIIGGIAAPLINLSEYIGRDRTTV